MEGVWLVLVLGRDRGVVVALVVGVRPLRADTQGFHEPARDLEVDSVQRPEPEANLRARPQVGPVVCADEPSTEEAPGRAAAVLCAGAARRRWPHHAMELPVRLWPDHLIAPLLG